MTRYKGAVNGVSIGGKIAHMQSIWDDRVAVDAPCESGGGGLYLNRGLTEGRINYFRGDGVTGPGDAAKPRRCLPRGQPPAEDDQRRVQPRVHDHADAVQAQHAGRERLYLPVPALRRAPRHRADGSVRAVQPEARDARLHQRLHGRMDRAAAAGTEHARREGGLRLPGLDQHHQSRPQRQPRRAGARQGSHRRGAGIPLRPRRRPSSKSITSCRAEQRPPAGTTHPPPPPSTRSPTAGPPRSRSTPTTSRGRTPKPTPSGPKAKSSAPASRTPSPPTPTPRRSS